MPQSREKQLQAMATCLNTPDGKVLMAELEKLWDGYSLLGEGTLSTGHKIGQRDAFKHLKLLSDGDTNE